MPSEKYSWINAKLSGFEPDITRITRNTIADGDILDSYVFKPLNARDEYLDTVVADITAKTDSLHDTITTQSATWNGNNLSGFNTIIVDNEIISANKNSKLNITTNALSAKVVDNTIKLSLPDHFKDSYFQRAYRTIKTNPWTDFPTPWGKNTALIDGYAAKTVLFGSGPKTEADLLLNSTNAFIINGDRINDDSKFGSTGDADGGIIINPGSIAKDEHFLRRGILLNGSKANSTYGGIAINGSVVNNDNNISINHSIINDAPDYCNCNLAINNSTINYYAPNSIAINDSSAFGFATIAINDSVTKTNCAIAMNGSSAIDYYSIALNNSVAAGTATLSLIRSTADSVYNVAILNSNVSVNSLCNFAAIDSYITSSSNDCIAMVNSTAKQSYCSTVFNYSTAYSAHNSLAYNNSYINDGHNVVVLSDSTVASSTSMNQYSIAVHNSDVKGSYNLAAFGSSSYGKQHSIALYGSIASGTSTAHILSFNGSSGFSPGISMFNSVNAQYMNEQFTQYMNYNVVMYQSIVDKIKPNLCESQSTTAQLNVVKYDSSAMVDDNTPIFLSATGVTGSNGMIYEELNNSSAMLNGVLLKYKSKGLGVNNIAEYSSVTNFGVSGCIAMYDSVASASAVLVDNNGAHTTSYNTIAMYNSSAFNTKNQILLWQNSVKIEPSGYINGIRYIDCNKTSAIPFDALEDLHKTDTSYTEFIIG